MGARAGEETPGRQGVRCGAAQSRDWKVQRPLEDGDVRLVGANISMEMKAELTMPLREEVSDFHTKAAWYLRALGQMLR